MVVLAQEIGSGVRTLLSSLSKEIVLPDLLEDKGPNAISSNMTVDQLGASVCNAIQIALETQQA